MNSLPPPAPRLRAQQAPLDFEPMNLPQSKDELFQKLSASSMCLACNDLELQRNSIIIENLAQQLSNYLPQEVSAQSQLEAASMNQPLFDLGSQASLPLSDSFGKGEKQSAHSMEEDILTCDASSFSRPAGYSSFQSQVAVSRLPCTEEEKRQFSESPVHYLFQNQQLAQAQAAV